MPLATDGGEWASCQSPHQHKGEPAATNRGWQTDAGKAAHSLETSGGPVGVWAKPLGPCMLPQLEFIQMTFLAKSGHAADREGAHFPAVR